MILFYLIVHTPRYIEKISARWAGGLRTVYQFRGFPPENHGTTLIKWRYFIVTSSTVYFCISGRVLIVAESRVVWIGEESTRYAAGAKIKSLQTRFDFRGSSVRVFFPIFFDSSPYFGHLFSVLYLRLVGNHGDGWPVCVFYGMIFSRQTAFGKNFTEPM